jgi:predicted amidophosphoribosyltransferase
LKYDGNVKLAVPLGIMLAQAYKRYGLQADMLIPVPLHSKRQQSSNCLTKRFICDKLEVSRTFVRIGAMLNGTGYENHEAAD